MEKYLKSKIFTYINLSVVNSNVKDCEDIINNHSLDKTVELLLDVLYTDKTTKKHIKNN